MVDFEYDSQYLSDYGFIVCKFDADSSFTYESVGSLIKFNKIAKYNGKKHSLTSTEYSECIAAEFDICKNPDIYTPNEMEISYDEYRDIVRWLNRREFLKFQAFDDCGVERDAYYYNASFNIQKIKLGGKLYGLKLKMETDKPFAYGREQVISLDFNNTRSSKIIRDVSDEIGYIRPSMIISCKEFGTLSVYNQLEDCTMVIKNCSPSEVITIDGENQIIETNILSHDIGKDFNYEFFRIGNTIDTRENEIRVSLPCSIVFKYFPIIKDIP